MSAVLFAAPCGAQNSGRFTVRPDLLAVEKCVAEPGGVPVPLAAGSLNLEVLDWRAAVLPTNHSGRFVLQFKEPVPAGTVLVYDAGVERLSGGQWSAVEGGGAVPGLRVMSMPAGPLDALRFTVPARAGAGGRFEAVLPYVLLMPPRLVNVASEAAVTTGWAETTDAAPGAGPHPLVDGRVDPVRNFQAPMRDTNASPRASDWVVLSWDRIRKLRGVAVYRGTEDAGYGEVSIDVLAGAGDPKTAKAGDWQYANGIMAPAGRFGAMQFFVFYGVQETRAVRLRSAPGLSRTGLGEVVVFGPVEAPAGAPKN